MPRALNEMLFNRLKASGNLSALTDCLRKNPHLMLNLRGTYATVYYKGLRVLEICQDGAFGFTPEYVSGATLTASSVFGKYISLIDDGCHFRICNDRIVDFPWTEFFSVFISGIDGWRSDNQEKCEKEIQQRIVMENNSFGDASATDYFIIDTEYTEQGNPDGGRFDAIALKWSRAMRASHNYKPGLALIEVKVGSGAIEGRSGIEKHLSDIAKFRVPDDFYPDLEEMVAQLRELGLLDIPGTTRLQFNQSDRPQFIFALANYNQRSELLWRNIFTMTEPENYDLRFATSSFIGYGLYDEGMLTLEQFKSLMPVKIYDKLKRASETNE